MKIVKSAILLIIILFLFSFSLFNGQPVKIRFFTWQTPDLPLFLVLVFAFALGFAVAALWGAVRSTGRGKKSARRKEKRGTDSAEKSIGKNASESESPGEPLGGDGARE